MVGHDGEPLVGLDLARDHAALRGRVHLALRHAGRALLSHVCGQSDGRRRAVTNRAQPNWMRQKIASRAVRFYTVLEDPRCTVLDGLETCPPRYRAWLATASAARCSPSRGSNGRKIGARILACCSSSLSPCSSRGCFAGRAAANPRDAARLRRRPSCWYLRRTGRAKRCEK